MNEKNQGTETLCKKCILHSRIPGITLNEDGVCNVCGSTEENSAFSKKYSKFLQRKMETLFSNIKKEGHKYDILVSYSGGKDSTFLLYLLKYKYHLNPLAFSVIHPMVNDNAKRNMKEVTEKLEIDLIQYTIDPEAYKKMMKYSLQNGYQYGIGERVGCITCGAIYKWASLKKAAELDIPIVADGVDQHQKVNFYNEGFIIDAEHIEHAKPAGVMHDIFHDTFGEVYDKNLMDFNMKDFQGKRFPMWISPFTFIENDYSEYFDKFLQLGLNIKNYKSLITNCSAVHMFDYLSLRRYNCVSYVREYSRLINEDDTLMDHKINTEKTEDSDSERISRETLLHILNEYKKILYFVVDNHLDVSNYNETWKQQIIEMAPVSYYYYGEEVFRAFLEKILTVNDHLEFFNINPDEINPINYEYKDVFIDQ